MKNKLIKRIGRIATAVTLAVTMCIPSGSNTIKVQAASDVVVDLSTEYQTMQGIGGMNHPVWISDLTASQRQTAFGNGANQLGFSILRIHIDENKNNWSKELATAQAAVKNGAIVFASPWNPPASMCEKFTRNGKPNQQRLKYSSYGAYADYLNEFVDYMKKNGVELYAISIQNEPDYADTWTWWTPQEMLNFMENYAGKINCRVIAPESFQYLKNMSDPILKSSKALANMDILGTHFYGTQVSNMSYPLFQQKGAGKELWMTEVYVPDSTTNADVWPNALQVSVNMNNAFAVGNMQTYVWWYIRRSYGPMKEDGTISKRGYCMAQYSKFIRRGYKRVGCTMSPASKVYVSAYKGDGKVVIVATNDSDSTYSQKFTVTNGTISKVDRYRTSASENLALTSNLDLTGNGFWASLPARSVSTFVCDLSNGSVTPSNPTQPSNPQPSNPEPSNPQPSNPTAQAGQIADGYYYIKGVGSQKYLSVSGNTGKNVQNVVISTGTGVDGQVWKVTNTGNGYFTLTSKLGSFNLDIGNGSADNGANVQIYQSHGGEAQQFMVKTTSQSGAYQICTRCSGAEKVLDVEGKKTDDGTNVCQYISNGQTNQMWIFEPVNNQPSQSTQPSNPAQPSEPSQPTQPSEPSQPSNPSTAEGLPAGVSCEYTVIGDWGGSYQAQIVLTNNSAATLNNWKLAFEYGNKITNLWGAELSGQTGSSVLVSAPSWDPNLAPGKSVTIQFIASGNSSVAPSGYSLK